MASKGQRSRGNAALLRAYWGAGAGAARIRWGTPGDWTRCNKQLRKYLGPRAKGYCARMHKARTGTWPGSRANAGSR